MVLSVLKMKNQIDTSVSSVVGVEVVEGGKSTTKPTTSTLSTCASIIFGRVTIVSILLFLWWCFLSNSCCGSVGVIAATPGKASLSSTNAIGSSISNLFTVYRRNPVALLSGTLRTYQKAACDEEWVNIRCPAGTTISIQLAQYGKTAPAATLCRSSNPNIFPDLMDPVTANSNFTCQWPAAIQTVVGLCQKKPSCKFQTSPQTFGGDPCPGSRKFVEVAYKCRPSEFRSVIGCQDDVIQLACNKSSRLAIYSANYGRTEYESVSCPQPSGVQEETCLASYATETVMQMCHGKRRCALGADPATFGNPCKPESQMYLKVIHTCVPRKVLKEKYQGEPEPDEIIDDETDSNNNNEDWNDPTEKIIEQPSIYSPSHTGSWDSSRGNGGGGSNTNHIPIQQPKRKGRTSQKPAMIATHHASDGEDHPNEESHQAKSSTVVGSGSHLGQDKPPTGNETNGDIRVIYLISQGISAYDFLSKNSHTLWLYIAVSITSALVLLFVLLLLNFACRRRRGGSRRNNRSDEGGGGESSGKESATLRRSHSGLSDTDELSVVMEPDEYIHLPSIIRRGDDISTFSPSAGGGTGTYSNRAVVRFSNSRSSVLSRQESDTNPRSLTSPHSNDPDLHFFYG